MMHMDPVMPQAVAAILLILITGLLVKLAKQPYIIAYLLAGVFIGPSVLGLVTDLELINRLGAIGVVLLLFFVGMETDAQKLIAHWKIAVFGTLFQILLSVLCVWLIGLWFDWPLSRVILIGFVISLSSTALVINLLETYQLLPTKIGQAVLGILLAQDLAIIFMLISIGFLGGQEVSLAHLAKQGLGAVLALAAFASMIKSKHFSLPFIQWVKHDKELQLFASLVVCFGLALISAWLELSTALGAFLAGMLIGAAKETKWVHNSLEPFKVLFVALFFVSVGLMLDIAFLQQNFIQVVALTIAALLTNSFINALILKVLRFDWQKSLFAGFLLSQIGEFSFVLAAVGLQSNIINQHGYQLVICVISLSLLLTPLWISLIKAILRQPLDAIKAS